MSWQDQAIQILRVLINDLSDEPTYQDDILEMTLRTAAVLVNQDITIFGNYTVSMIACDIIPDPSNDEVFINFIVLKAACIISNWKFNDKAIIEGLRARCGPAELQVSAGSTVLLGLIKEGPCKTYDQLKIQAEFGNITAIRGILGPFVSNVFRPLDLGFRNNL